MNMKIILLCVSFCFAVAIAGSIRDSDNLFSTVWNNYKAKFGKKYSVEEDDDHRKIFKERLEEIRHHNERFENKEVSYKQGINKFSDMRDEDVLILLGHNATVGDVEDAQEFDYELDIEKKKTIDKTFDWRDHKAVTKVKDNKKCNRGDWAFATAGALEYVFSIKHGNLTELSEQDLINCCGKCGDYSCYGGSLKDVTRCIEDQGVFTETSCPFVGKKKDCPKQQRDGITIPEAKQIKRFKISSTADENLKSHIFENGPIIAEIEITPQFLKYSGGIFDGNDCGKRLRPSYYTILIVGYEESAEWGEYWIVKNCWGSSWGDNGYIKITSHGTCGINKNTSYFYLTSQRI